MSLQGSDGNPQPLLDMPQMHRDDDARADPTSQRWSRPSNFRMPTLRSPGKFGRRIQVGWAPGTMAIVKPCPSPHGARFAPNQEIIPDAEFQQPAQTRWSRVQPRCNRPRFGAPSEGRSISAAGPVEPMTCDQNSGVPAGDGAGRDFSSGRSGVGRGVVLIARQLARRLMVPARAKHRPQCASFWCSHKIRK
jgi:hypothetical protein